MIYTNDIRAFAKNNILISEIFWPYRAWYTVSWWFKKFLTDKDWNIKETFWNKEERKFVQVPIEWREYVVQNDSWDFCKEKMWAKPTKWFYKVYKNKFDLVVHTENPVEVEVWDKDTKSKVKKSWSEFTIQWISQWKIWQILIWVSIIEEIPTKWDKPVFDWELPLAKKLEWKTFRFTVSWKDLDTQYIIKEWKSFTAQDEEFWVSAPF